MLNMRPNDPHSAEDRKRILVAVVLTFACLLLYHIFYVMPHRAQLQAEQDAQQRIKAETAKENETHATTAAGKTVPGKKVAVFGADKGPISRSDALKESARVPVDGARIEGSISLKGARFDDIRLNEYFQDGSKTDKVALLSPSDTQYGYWVDNGWIAGDGGADLPNKDTVWTLSPKGAQRVKSGGAPVILEWDNGHGLKFEQDISLDEDFLFTIAQRVTNTTSSPVALNAYHTTSRNNLPQDFRGFYALHEGPIGSFDGKTVDPQYKSLVGTKGGYDLQDKTGWLGISDRYWLVTMLPKPDQHFNATIKGENFGPNQPGQHYQADIVDTALTVNPGQTTEEKSYLYTGAKNLKAIQNYQETLGFKNFEVTFDFGIYYIITKPFYYLLTFLINFSSKITSSMNVGLGMIFMTVIVRAMMFPVASKAFSSMAKMRVVGPQMKELQEKYKDDKVKLQSEVFELYKKYDVNPFSGCMPIFIQVPVFFALYKVILLSVELRLAPFWGWIPDLSSPDPTSIFNLFGLLPFHPPFSITLGAWPCIYCLTMVLQKRITPPMPDPNQERMQAYFPYLFSFMMSQFPSGLVIYYSWSNLLGVIQQYYILKKVGGEDTSLLRGHAGRRKQKIHDKHKGEHHGGKKHG